jgi:RimJ/RimL family protein N-acetyltransferase
VEVAVSVHPYHRREGLGRRLVARAMALAFAEGAEAAVLLLAPENRAIARLAGSLRARLTAMGCAILTEAPSAEGVSAAMPGVLVLAA